MHKIEINKKILIFLIEDRDLFTTLNVTAKPSKFLYKETFGINDIRGNGLRMNMYYIYRVIHSKFLFTFDTSYIFG